MAICKYRTGLLVADYDNINYYLRYSFDSFDEYYQYVRCVSNLQVGDAVDMYVNNNALTTYKTHETVPAIVVATGFAERILIGIKTPGYNFYPHTAGYKDRARAELDRINQYPEHITDYNGYNVFYIQRRANIQARVAKIVKKKHLSLIDKV